MTTLADIANLLNVPLPAGADPKQAVRSVASLADAEPADLTYVSSDAWAKYLATTRAGAVVLHKRVQLTEPPSMPALVVDDAELAIGKILGHFAPPVPRPPAGVDPAARVAATAQLGDGAAVGFNAFVGERVTVGKRSVLHPGVYVGDDCAIGDDCELFPGVVVRERITLGHRVILNANTVLGTDGFGYRWDGTHHRKTPQIGTVVIEDDVEIGSCTCIDRAKFGVTRIGRGTKMDNLVQIAHNVRTGPHCILAGQSGVAGTTTLGTGVVCGGQSAVRDHITLGDGATLAACSAVMGDLAGKTVYSGMPALPHRQTLREQAALRELPDLRIQVRKLQERLDALEGK